MAKPKTQSQMHLAAFVTAGPGRPGGWRFPSSESGWLDGDYYRRIAQTLERGRFDMAFFADILAVPDRFEGSNDSQLRYGSLGSLRLDPLQVLQLMGASTSRLGLAATRSTSYYQPFEVARSFATLDHLTAGRAAWNVVTSFQDAEARNFSLNEQFPRNRRYDRADEFLEVATKLWDSWEDDALQFDRQTPLFADPEKVHYIDYKGEWFNVRGPLNVPRPPQGYPVIIQAGASDRGRDFAARWADVIFVSHDSIDSAIAFYREMKERVVRFGRSPDSLKILPSITPVVAETKSLAEEKAAILRDLVEPRAGLTTLSYHLDVDLSAFPLDEPLPNVEVPGVQGHYDEVREATARDGLTLGDLGKRYGSRYEGDMIGDAQHVSDKLVEWFERGAADGFTVSAPYQPGGFDDFVRLVVPELQKRGVFRADYAGSTLRDHLGLERPEIGGWESRSDIRRKVA
ncbi:LLM class flavin-dependent oxidoreductase [Phyllobacterium endophyticum]|uniref:LLM class flavin-dependent oxidoreductase n=1 Tax=Phyllobacterium endophyticum TaxID=1149773 RepID=UPI001FEF57CE|nr:LLM class flavin-dependent oxidoreductase [Phyllobacterium endophyticum]